MRPHAEVEPGIALAVDRDRLAALGDFIDPFGLVGLADRLEILDGLGGRPFLAGDRQVALDDLGHALLDLAEILRRDRLVAHEVVVEAVRTEERRLGKGGVSTLKSRWSP